MMIKKDPLRTEGENVVPNNPLIYDKKNSLEMMKKSPLEGKERN